MFPVTIDPVHAHNTERSASAIILPIFALFGVILTLPPIVWHARNKNIAACGLIFWIILGNIFTFTNALIWFSNDVSTWWNGVGYCDVQVKLQWPITTGSAGAICAMMRNLAIVVDVDRAQLYPSRSQRRRAMIIDLSFCFAYPIFAIGIHYVVQPNRYNLITISGCDASYDNSWPSVVLFFMWAPLFSIWAAYYCVLLIYRLIQYRRQFSTILSSVGPSLNKSRFLRLFILSFTLLLINLPTELYFFHGNVVFPKIPYSWKLIHEASAWNQVGLIPTGGQALVSRWLLAASAFVVFFFFGLGKDATEMYRGWLLSVGLGGIFPNLQEQRRRHPNLSGSTVQGSLTSYSSRAKLFFSRKSSKISTSISALGSFPSRHDSLSTIVQTPSPSDPKKGFQTNLDSIVEPDQHQEIHQLPTREIRAPPPIDPQPWRRFSFDTPMTTSQPPVPPSRAHLPPSGDLEPQGSTVFTDVWGGFGRAQDIEQGGSLPVGNGVRIETHLQQTSRIDPGRSPK